MAIAARPIRAAIVGCGAISHTHAAAILRNPDVIQLVACANRGRERREAFASKYAVTGVYADYREMVRRQEPELVILATWPIQHEEQVLACIEEGVLGILCEKSLTVSGQSAVRMASAASTARTLLVEGFMYRHHPRTLRAIELLREGKIGRLLRVRAGFHFATADPTSWRKDPGRGGGVVFDATCYCVNALGAFIGILPERVSAEWTRTEDGLVESMYGTLRYPAGIMGQIESSQTCSYREPLELQGERGTIYLEHAWTPVHTSDVQLITGSIWSGSFSIEQIGAGASDPYEEQLLHICQCLRTGARPRFPVEESVRNLFVIDALMHSAETRSYVSPQVPYGL